MIDAKKIEEFQECIFEDTFLNDGVDIMLTDGGAEPYKVEMYDKGQIMHAVELGVYWAQVEFKKSLWHDGYSVGCVTRWTASLTTAPHTPGWRRILRVTTSNEN